MDKSLLVLMFCLAVGIAVEARSFNTFNHAGIVNTVNQAGVINIGAAANPYAHLYPSYSGPRPASPHTAPTTYDYTGANIGQVNHGCNSPGTCNIHGSTIRGRKKRESERVKRDNHFLGTVHQVNSVDNAHVVNIGHPSVWQGYRPVQQPTLTHQPSVATPVGGYPPVQQPTLTHQPSVATPVEGYPPVQQPTIIHPVAGPPASPHYAAFTHTIPTRNDFIRANIGQINHGCNSPGTCNIHGPVIGKK